MSADYAGWVKENNKPVFWLRLESTTDGNYVQAFGRVPSWSRDGLGIGYVKHISNKKFEGSTAVLYVTAYCDLDDKQIVKIGAESIEKFKLQGNSQH